MSDLITWANGDGTFSYIPESQIPAMMQSNQIPTSPPKSIRTFELIDLMFLGALVIFAIIAWKEPIGYFALGMLIAWLLIGVMN